VTNSIYGKVFSLVDIWCETYEKPISCCDIGQSVFSGPIVQLYEALDAETVNPHITTGEILKQLIFK